MVVSIAIRRHVRASASRYRARRASRHNAYNAMRPFLTAIRRDRRGAHFFRSKRRVDRRRIHVDEIAMKVCSRQKVPSTSLLISDGTPATGCPTANTARRNRCDSDKRVCRMPTESSPAARSHSIGRAKHCWARIPFAHAVGMLTLNPPPFLASNSRKALCAPAPTRISCC